jgi:S-adenosylmethionine:tRNA ribosyltransferase-isomerase
MRIEEFDYLLPKEMIAQYPAEERTASRLLVFNRGKDTIEHRHFQNITDYLREGDLLVLMTARFFLRGSSGRKVPEEPLISFLLKRPLQTNGSAL